MHVRVMRDTHISEVVCDQETKEEGKRQCVCHSVVSRFFFWLSLRVDLPDNCCRFLRWTCCRINGLMAQLIIRILRG